jgi:hypothetical protein
MPPFLAYKHIFLGEKHPFKQGNLSFSRETSGAKVARVLALSQADIEPGIQPVASDILCFLRQCAILNGHGKVGH